LKSKKDILGTKIACLVQILWGVDTVKQLRTLIAYFSFSVAILGCVGSANSVPFPGPDAFGYEGKEITNNIRDVRVTGTRLALADDATTILTLPFSFGFYGSTKSNVVLSSNGFLNFSTTQAGLNGLPIPVNDAFDDLIAGYWTDLFQPGGGIIAFETQGDVGSREFIAGFYDVRTIVSDTFVTFEMILHEATNDIEFQYGRMDAGASLRNTTVGIENSNGTDALALHSAVDDDIVAAAVANRGFCISNPNTGNNCGISVSEPGSLALVGVGLAGLSLLRRRKFRFGKR
jgi:hypothetical protein